MSTPAQTLYSVRKSSKSGLGTISVPLTSRHDSLRIHYSVARPKNFVGRAPCTVVTACLVVALCVSVSISGGASGPNSNTLGSRGAKTMPDASGSGNSSTPGVVCLCACLHCGGGGPSHVYLTIAIFSDDAEPQLNGSVYSNGGVATLQAGKSVALSVHGLGSKVNFSLWESDVGSFGSSTASSTTFSAVNEEATGTLAMILNATAFVSPNPWAGYVVDDEEAGFSCLSGEYYNVPATTYVGPAGGVDINSIWIGIGGVENNQSLWQAGINVYNQGGTTLYWVPFTEEATSTSSSPNWVGPESSAFPSALLISVCSSNGRDSAQIEAYYASTGDSLWWNETSSGFWPDTYTAEWILEDPVSGTSRVPIGAFASFGVINPSWTLNGESVSEFLGPLAFMALKDTAYETQFVNPGAITDDFEQYSLTYST